MQVDPIKHNFKAPGTDLLTLEYDELLSIFAFRFNLRRYIAEDHVDTSAGEMMQQLKREADAYVNPQTGKAMRWGDTWRHEWGGGVGVGRPEGRPRRMMPDGTTAGPLNV